MRRGRTRISGNRRDAFAIQLQRERWRQVVRHENRV